MALVKSSEDIPVYESLLYKVSRWYMRLYEFRSASNFIIIGNFMVTHLTVTDSLNTIMV